ncbi:hypothetical protein QQM39_28430 [Streptomyces sp. DT2A-34]|uniref:hypothetical protein n=1 Tax=Streptomyces sp. DT2A-34 TaxID=3051182 RepID=UPI00265C2DBC|nr:hypothetical protein [Streptomyces sp. DT2A-34]MDO0914619.1 hypothetical protein [Streptomyces sp. DT2A-34]
MTSEHTRMPDDCRLCGTFVPDAEFSSVVHDTGRHCSVQYPVCKDCHTPEFQAYLDELWAFWKGRTNDAA